MLTGAIYPKISVVKRHIQNGVIELLGWKFLFDGILGITGINLGVISGNLNKIQHRFKVVGKGLTISTLVRHNVAGRTGLYTAGANGAVDGACFVLRRTRQTGWRRGTVLHRV